MNYAQALSFAQSRTKLGIRPGLSRIRELLRRLGDPQAKLGCIHIAGTNGKGSTAAMLAQILTESGLKTGLYTSPYITDYLEPLTIDADIISHERFTELMEEISVQVLEMDAKGEQVTEFELMTAAAYLYFSQEGCSAAVIECGLGGAEDATNVIDSPLCSIITHIGLDHTDILGHTIREIAAHKAGIIKRGCPVICAPNQPEEALEVIRSRALELGSPLTAAEVSDVSGLNSAMKGAVQRENAASAQAAAGVLRDRGLAITDDAVRRGIEKARLCARAELLTERPAVILDGTHNPDGAAALSRTLDELLEGKKALAVMGMLADKDAESVLRLLSRHFSRIIAVDVPSPRAMKKESLKELAQSLLPESSCESTEEALITAKREREQGTPVVICGSFYLAREIRDRALEVFLP